MKHGFIAILLSLNALCIPTMTAGVNEDAALAAINAMRPGSTGYGAMSVKKVNIDNRKKIITVSCNETTANLPLTAEKMQALKADILSRLGARFKDYKVVIKAGDTDLDALVLFAPKHLTGPAETAPFVTDLDAEPASAGLQGANIALWQSHGWYYEPKLDRWEWQRARIFETVEDLYTQSYVMPFLMPMLRNAGAYVMSPRERDTNLTEIIVDGSNTATSGYSERNGSRRWEDAPGNGFGWNGQPLGTASRPFSEGTARSVATVSPEDQPSQAVWTADIPQADDYAVYISYAILPDAAPDAKYTVHTAEGDRHFTVNQQMGAGTWIYLGHFPLAAGRRAVVTLDNTSAIRGTAVSADAVKIGGGMGLVARTADSAGESSKHIGQLSGYPKFTEGARYFLQWAGAPDSVFTPSAHVNDYTDDYKSRGLWVNWLAGGSSMLPGRKGLRIPVDLSFAFHTDAGTFKNDSIVGTLGIYSTAGDTLGNGSDRIASRDFTDLVMTSITDDVRATYEPRWTRRGMWDKSYYEARVPEVPAMLLEFLSHQNFADMKYGLDPAFRFVVSRAIYKGMLRFLARRDGRPYIVQPLPVKDFAINAVGNRTYRLAWTENVDTLESTAHPTHYIIEERVGDALSFQRIATADTTFMDVTVSDSDIHSYRIIAANDGGTAFPSEVLALCDLGNGSAPVTVVNGFTRISAPDSFEYGESFGGFNDASDRGVPYIEDISYIGAQYDFRRDRPWRDDDAPGFGASNADFEGKVVAGNTFDYVYTHGTAIAAAGRSFISSSASAWAAAPVDSAATVVDIILGKQKEIARGRYGTQFKTFTPAMQAKIAAQATAGTSFLVSGAYVATDLSDNPHSSAATAKADIAFAREVLGYDWRTDRAAVTGSVKEVNSRYDQFEGADFSFRQDWNADVYAVESPDAVIPAADGASTIMRYSENNIPAAVAARMGKYSTVVLGFPFEVITSPQGRNTLMRQTLEFFKK